MIRHTCISLIMLGLVASVSNAQAQTNGGFESPAITEPNIVILAGSTSLSGWTIEGTSGIDLVGSLWQAGEGSQSISLNWVSPSTISQTLSTEMGQSYTISFLMAAEANGGPALRTMDVYWNSSLVASPTFVYTGQDPSNMEWTSFKYQVSGTGSDVLRFASTTPDDYGPALDAVSVTSTPVPEPGWFALLVGTTVSGISMLMRRRRVQFR